MRRRLFPFAGLGLVLGCAPSPTPAAAPAELVDYLVQDVCVDGAGRAVAGDPASCARRRNLRIGERLPYLVTDYDRSSGTRLSAVSSLPVRGADGGQRVAVVKLIGHRLDRAFAGSFQPKADGFDLIDVPQRGAVSIIRTYDPGCFDQLFAPNPRARRSAERRGGWLLFPASAPSGWAPVSSEIVTTYRTQLSAAPKACASNHATGLTRWYAPAATPFENGRTLRAIRSDHIAAADLGQAENSFERFYFTREYGLSRWEAWQTLAYCRKMQGAGSARCSGNPAVNPLAARCGARSGRGRLVEEAGGQGWIMMDCRDTTLAMPLERSAYPLTAGVGRGLGVTDVDYDATVGGGQPR